MSKLLKRKHARASTNALKRKKLHHITRHGSAVQVEALRWKEVQLPDRLEDAEGFYGLEEIDDVEIVKDEDGQISFRPRTDEDIIVGEGEVPGEEWGGFGNDSEEVVNGASSEDQSSSTDAKSVKGMKKELRREPKQKSRQTKLKAQEDLSTTTTKTQTTETADFEDELNFNTLEDAPIQTQVDVTAWQELDLSPDMRSAISTLGFSEPTAIQRAAIPQILEGRDVIGKAVTGSGKTLAFGIPIIDRWLEDKSSQSKDDSSIPTAFVLAPTRELAHQLSKHMQALCKGLEQSPRIATVTGGLALVKQERQLELADIVIGTPGRLWEVINSSHGLIDRLKQIQFLVIDEADRLLSEGHFKEVEEILDVLDREVINEDNGGKTADGEAQTRTTATKQQRQTLVFSATFHKGLQQKLATKQKWHPNDSNLLSNAQSLDYLLKKLRFQPGTKPAFVDANPALPMAENLSESILECGAMQKDLYLYSLLLLHQHNHSKAIRSKNSAFANDRDKKDNVSRMLVFTNSISTVKRLVPLLSTLCIPNTQILPLHSSMPQKARLRSLERFTIPASSTTSTTTTTTNMSKASITTSVLIATDVAARGLDIKGIDTIIHYHVPRTADMYVHRSGRTARASSSGRSILICSPDEVGGVTRLISKIHADKSTSPSTAEEAPKANPKPTAAIHPFYLPASLPTQLTKRVSLAQKITETQLSTSQSKSEDSWLRNAAEELGVDYSSDEFVENGKRGRRGRGGAESQKKKRAVEESESGKVRMWKEELKREMMTANGGNNNGKVDFGDGESGFARGARYLAGGAVDVERLLRDGVRD